MEKIIGEIELHSVAGIKECFRNGVSPNDRFRGEPLIYELTSEYTRSPDFKDCVKAFVDHGLIFDDKAMLAILLDDANALRRLLQDDPEIVRKCTRSVVPIHRYIKLRYFTFVLNLTIFPVLRCW